MEEPEIEYFFDTYSIVEVLKQSPSYEKYNNKKVTVTIFNLAELYWVILRDYDEEKADKVYATYKEAVQEIDDETLKEAIKFRKKHKKQDLSYTDCMGYIYALRHNMKFLTGDKEFKTLKNVEFVK